MPALSLSEIKPELKYIPEDVFDAINHLLSKRIITSKTNQQIIINQEEVIRLVVEKGSFSRARLFEEKALDFEEHYRLKGWKVFYNKPAYYETYIPYWIFKT